MVVVECRDDETPSENPYEGVRNDAGIQDRSPEKDEKHCRRSQKNWDQEHSQ